MPLNSGEQNVHPFYLYISKIFIVTETAYTTKTSPYYNIRRCFYN